jgi:CHAT domain
MVQPYYTYRIRITNADSVQVEKIDAENRERNQPIGKFGYKAEAKRRIQELHKAAHENKLTGTEIQELGEKLFEALFDGGLQNDFSSFYAEALRNKAFLRIELDVDEEHLQQIAALPWEFMRIPGKKGYSTFWLGTNPHLIFSRRRSRGGEPEPIQLEEGEPLRIALAISAPNGLIPVKHGTILQELSNWAKKQIGRVELLDIINPATPRTIDQMLEQKPHIFHFIGHGRLKDEDQHDVRQIALVDSILNDPLWLGAQEFSELLDRHQPGIVILQACESATSSNSEAFVSVASYIVQQNIPVVVAMQYEVSNATAQTFALEFYKRIAQGEPVDKAAQEGRRSIALGPPRYTTREFATPVLFMRVKDGRLFLSSWIDDNDRQDTQKQLKIIPIASYRNDEQSFSSNLVKIRDILVTEQKRFIRGQVVYQDGCKPSIIAVKELNSLLQNLPSTVRHSYSLTVPFSNILRENEDLARLLDTFHSICPPSSNYRQVPRQRYDDDCEAISKHFSTLIQSLQMLIRRLDSFDT